MLINDQTDQVLKPGLSCSSNPIEDTPRESARVSILNSSCRSVPTNNQQLPGSDVAPLQEESIQNIEQRQERSESLEDGEIDEKNQTPENKRAASEPLSDASMDISSASEADIQPTRPPARSVKPRPRNTRTTIKATNAIFIIREIEVLQPREKIRTQMAISRMGPSPLRDALAEAPSAVLVHLKEGPAQASHRLILDYPFTRFNEAVMYERIRLLPDRAQRRVMHHFYNGLSYWHPSDGCEWKLGSTFHISMKLQGSVWHLYDDGSHSAISRESKAFVQFPSMLTYFSLGGAGNAGVPIDVDDLDCGDDPSYFGPRDVRVRARDLARGVFAKTPVKAERGKETV